MLMQSERFDNQPAAVLKRNLSDTDVLLNEKSIESSIQSDLQLDHYITEHCGSKRHKHKSILGVRGKPPTGAPSSKADSRIRPGGLDFTTRMLDSVKVLNSQRSIGTMETEAPGPYRTERSPIVRDLSIDGISRDNSLNRGYSSNPLTQKISFSSTKECVALNQRILRSDEEISNTSGSFVSDCFKLFNGTYAISYTSESNRDNYEGISIHSEFTSIRNYVFFACLHHYLLKLRACPDNIYKRQRVQALSDRHNSLGIYKSSPLASAITYYVMNQSCTADFTSLLRGQEEVPGELLNSCSALVQSMIEDDKLSTPASSLYVKHIREHIQTVLKTKVLINTPEFIRDLVLKLAEIIAALLKCKIDLATATIAESENSQQGRLPVLLQKRVFSYSEDQEGHGISSAIKTITLCMHLTEYRLTIFNMISSPLPEAITTVEQASPLIAIPSNMLNIAPSKTAHVQMESSLQNRKFPFRDQSSANGESLLSRRDALREIKVSPAELQNFASAGNTRQASQTREESSVERVIVSSRKISTNQLPEAFSSVRPMNSLDVVKGMQYFRKPSLGNLNSPNANQPSEKQLFRNNSTLCFNGVTPKGIEDGKSDILAQLREREYSSNNVTPTQKLTSPSANRFQGIKNPSLYNLLNNWQQKSKQISPAKRHHHHEKTGKENNIFSVNTTSNFSAENFQQANLAQKPPTIKMPLQEKSQIRQDTSSRISEAKSVFSGHNRQLSHVLPASYYDKMHPSSKILVDIKEQSSRNLNIKLNPSTASGSNPSNCLERSSARMLNIDPQLLETYNETKTHFYTQGAGSRMTSRDHQENTRVSINDIPNPIKLGQTGILTHENIRSLVKNRKDVSSNVADKARTRIAARNELKNTMKDLDDYLSEADQNTDIILKYRIR